MEMEIASSSEPLDLDTIRSRISELEEIYRTCNDDDGFPEMPSSDSDELLQDCALQLESKVQQILADCSDVSFLGIEDLDAYLEHLKEELNTAEAENARITSEIEGLSRTNLEDSNRLESDIEMLKCSLDLISSQDSVKGIEGECFSYGEDQSELINSYGDQKLELVKRCVWFQIFKLDDQIEKSKTILKSMQDFDLTFKRLDTIEQIEAVFSGLKVIEFDGSCIRLSLVTFIPKLEDASCLQNLDDIGETSEVNHEFQIEVVTGSMEPKNVEMFPNDVYIGDITDAAKSFRQLHSEWPSLEMRSSLEWFVNKVQDRIVECTLRRLVVKHANHSRYSLEYWDRDETIVAHLVGGIDAVIKVPQGWPISPCPLGLISFRNPAHHSKDISLTFLCKIEEMANSLDVHVRQNLCNFVDAVEKALVEQTRLELQADKI
ncbi:hypothetical protein Tsubulata_002549 [Turnera subulata]|uniref:Uncharacterized protein n=1 Tax=Turnera subulata TaxID=218843 RepID=A0A9Q0G9D9_9ROSI|nr:hypothetical protein Tsubulata_002549 [Turnera subulata]